MLAIVVAHNGPSLPDGFDLSQGKGLEMRIILTLVKQLDGGDEATDQGGGASFVVRCPAEEGPS